MTDMLRIEDSGGALGLTEVQLDPGAEAPVADHEPADHGYYVIDGELSVLLGEQDARLSKGGFAFAPGGVAHRVANEGDAPATPSPHGHPGGDARRCAKGRPRPPGARQGAPARL